VETRRNEMTAEGVMEMGCAGMFVPVGVVIVGLSTLVFIFPGFGHFTLYMHSVLLH
jgi:hypothetical protein